MTNLLTTSFLLGALLAAQTLSDAKLLRALSETQVAFSDAEPGSNMTSDPAGDNMIVGGTNVQPGQLPFFGYFEGSTLCSGILTHKDIFLTAAHCVKDGFPSLIKIGATTTTTAKEGQEASICAGYIHPNNTMKDMENDIAVLKLCDPVTISSYAKWNSDPAFPSYTGYDLWVAGFGRTSTNSAPSAILQIAKLNYLTSDVCENRYNKYDPLTNICADSTTAGICYGDSGSPLMTSDNLVVGLASYIVDTCASSYPDFFSRLSTYDAWLNQMTCTKSMAPPSSCTEATSGSTGSTTDSGISTSTTASNTLSTCLSFLAGIFSGFTQGIQKWWKNGS